jgi:hypothetical protein
MNEPQTILTKLRLCIEQNEAWPDVVDPLVAEIISQGDKSQIGELLNLLSDESRHDASMFTLIHAAETLDDEVYIACLLRNFSAIANRAPKWAGVLLMRVLNNEHTRQILVRSLPTFPAFTKRAIASSCKQIQRQRPQFQTKIEAVLTASE